MIDDGAFDRLDALLLAALDLPPGERPVFLDKTCGPDVALRAELEALLAGADRPDFLEQPAIALLQSGLPPSSLTASAVRGMFDAASRFHLRRQLGEGGFGVVFEAFDSTRQEVVALKVLHRTEPAALARFKDEFRRLAGIHHPNLIELFELFYERDLWFFSMEIVHGPDFFTYTRQHGAASAPGGITCDVERLRRAAWQLAQGITALHAHGILHRDVKPANVLMTEHEIVRLLDFGLTREIKPGPAGHSVVGTYDYVAPEQLQGQSVEAADWFSFGVMIVEALTGTRPPRDRVADPFRDPTTGAVYPGVPEDLKRLGEELLREDPLRRPSGKDIVAQLGGAGSLPVRVNTPARQATAPLIGRESQFAELEDALNVTCLGHTAIVNLRGRSGIGKTTLLRSFEERVTRDRPDVVVLAGRCHERESVPFKALDALVDRLAEYLSSLSEFEATALVPRDAHHLVRVFPVLAQIPAMRRSRHAAAAIADSRELRLRAFASLQDLFARIAERAVLVLIIDDLQWGDLDSAAFFAQLFRNAAPPSLLFIASYRTEDRHTSPFLQEWHAQWQPMPAVAIRDVEVGELTPEQSRELAEELLTRMGAADLAAAHLIAAESGGSPFLADQLVRHVSVATAAAPEQITVERVICERVSGLPVHAQRLLEVIAVAGQPISESLARTAAGSPHHSSLSTLLAERLARVREAAEHKEIEVYHDRIREAVVGAMPSETRRRQHLALAETLEASGQSHPDALAVHLFEAGEHQRAAAYAAVAGDAAFEALAFERAARFYRSALDNGVWDSDDAIRLRRKLGLALVHVGRGVEAARVYLEAAEGAASICSEFHRLAAEQLLRSGHIGEGVALLERTARNLGIWLPAARWQTIASVLWHRACLAFQGRALPSGASGNPPAERVAALDVYWSFAAGLAIFDPIRSMDFHTRHLLWALRLGDQKRAAKSLALDAAYQAVQQGRMGPAIAEPLDLARQLSERVQRPEIRGLIGTISAMCAALTGNWRSALEGAEEAERILRDECTGISWELATCLEMWSIAAFHLGRWNALRRFCERIANDLEEGKRRGDIQMLQASFPMACAISFASDQTELVDTLVQEISSALPSGGFLLPHVWMVYVTVLSALYRGEPDRAWAYVSSRWPALRRSHFLRLPYVAVCAIEARARAAIAMAVKSPGESGRYLEDALTSAKRLKRIGDRWGHASGLLVEAGVASVRREMDQAARLLESAEPGFRALEMSHLVAACQNRRGALVGGEEGQTLRAAAEAWAIEEGVVDPSRVFNMLAPGAWPEPMVSRIAPIGSVLP